MLFSVATSSCKDDKDEPNNSNSIVGTWVCERSIADGLYYDNYTLVFSKDNTGYIRNEYGDNENSGTRGSSTEQMNFNWSLTTTANGQSLLSVIYASGDREMDGPFDGNYAQWNRTVTIAGNTLSISLGESVMLFIRK